MAITNTRLIDTDPTNVFTATAQTVITTVYICNTDITANASVNVHAINSDDSTASSEDNAIYSNLLIAAGDTYVLSTERLILDASDLLEVQSNVANVITVTVSSYNM